MKINYQHVPTLPSTNTYAKEHLSIFDKNELHVIFADEQTGGRGRKNRSWVSPKGNLFATFTFHLDSGLQYKTAPLGIVLATVIASYQETLGLPFQIKWPNDLLLNRFKVGGLLGETVASDEGVWVILGVGINFSLDKEELEKIDQEATSLHLFAGEFIDPVTYLKEVSSQFELAVDAFKKQGFAPFYPLWEKYNALQKGQPIRLETAEEIIDGRFLSLEEDGSISITRNQQKETYSSAEIL